MSSGCPLTSWLTAGPSLLFVLSGGSWLVVLKVVGCVLSAGDWPGGRDWCSAADGSVAVTVGGTVCTVYIPPTLSPTLSTRTSPSSPPPPVRRTAVRPVRCDSSKCSSLFSRSSTPVSSKYLPTEYSQSYQAAVFRVRIFIFDIWSYSWYFSAIKTDTRISFQWIKSTEITLSNLETKYFHYQYDFSYYWWTRDDGIVVRPPLQSSPHLEFETWFKMFPRTGPRR